MERKGVVFEVVITKYNYTKGYIPINKEMQFHFPKVSIKSGFIIYLNEKDIISNCTYTYSSRKYISGGDELKKWYSENFRINDKIHVCLMDENKIELSLIKISEHNTRPKIEADENRNIKKQLSINNESNYKTVKHMALDKDWESKNNEVDGPITLILGSFNPYFTESKTGFYYGRIAKAGIGNQFWKSIGRKIKNDEDYFQNNTELKLEAMKEFKFIFMDIIDEIKFTYANEDGASSVFQEYKLKKINGGFGDDDIFVTNHNFKSEKEVVNYTLAINLTRTYNERIVKVLRENLSIRYVVNTMGNNKYGRFDQNKTEVSFQKFKKSISKVLAEREEINFDTESISPSAQSNSTKEEIDNWIRKKVLRI